MFFFQRFLYIVTSTKEFMNFIFLIIFTFTCLPTHHLFASIHSFKLKWVVAHIQNIFPNYVTFESINKHVKELMGSSHLVLDDKHDFGASSASYKL